MADALKYLLLCLLCWSPVASAHNVIGGVYAIGNTIEGEVGFSNGEMASAGFEVIVSDGAGNELGRTLTDDEGLFSFTAAQRLDHHFRVNLSSGHVLDVVLPADELPDTLSGPVGNPSSATAVAAVAAPVLAGSEQAQLQVMIEAAVAKQVKPLRQELAAYKEKASLQDAIGGIGYIFGLCGIGIWWRQRQQQRQSQRDKAAQG